MPNLTSYRASPIHLNRDFPKTSCDLIRHEIDYIHFLRTRIANIQSSLVFTNKKRLIQTNNTQQRRYFDHNQRLFHVYQRNLQLCKKILHIWTNNGEHKGGVDCHNEHYKTQTNISHFRLRQKQWKDKIENENKRFIHSLISHRKKYRPIHDRYIAQESFAKHLKLLQTMSQYPKYILTNPIHKNLLDYNDLPESIHYNFSQFYSLNRNFSLQTQCRTLPHSYKFTNKKSKRIKIKFNKRIKTNQSSPTYIQNLLQQTINDAIYIYKQSLPSAPKRFKSSYSENAQWSKPRLYQQQELFRSASCRRLLEPWHNTKQQSETLRDYNIDKKSSFLRSYHQIRNQKRIGINQHLSNSFKKNNQSSSIS